MKKKFSAFIRFSNGLSGILFSCILLTGLNSCTKYFYNGLPVASIPTHIPLALSVDSSKWVSWNIMFSARLNDASRTQQINSIKDYVTNYLALYGYIPSFREIYCPCDSTLYNLNVTPLYASGSSFQPPPPPPPPQGGSGGDIPYVASINNSLLTDVKKQIEDPNYNPNTGNKYTLNKIGTNSKLLAIMDTGLDPDYFDSQISQLIWNDPHRAKTLRNFTFNNPSLPDEYFNDDHLGKHGTAVTTIALQAMGNVPSYPHIMVLKVLDKNESGSTFNVGCALSYAIQNHATIINASLGYYPTTHDIPDPVLFHYLNLCNTAGTDSIFVFAAAGNLPLPHNNPLCSSPTPTGNNLSDVTGRLFYPACFSDNLHNVITITGLKDFNQSCIYQNYSEKYVSIGVLNQSPSCCSFSLQSINLGFEGSSFATPFASGKVMGRLLSSVGATVPSIRQCINFVTQTNGSLLSVTKDGRYIDNGSSQ